MKTGKVARTFRIDPKTVISWTDTFAEFFSTDAQSSDVSGQAQRNYVFDDLVVLNTICGFKALRLKDDDIRVRLADGDRDEMVPPEAATIQGENAIAIYTQMKTLQVRLEGAEQEAERLSNEINERDTRHREEIQGKDQRIEQLNQEIGMWRARYEMLKEQLEDEDE